MTPVYNIPQATRISTVSQTCRCDSLSSKYYYVYKTSGNSKIFIDGIINRDCGVAVAFRETGFQNASHWKICGGSFAAYGAAKKRAAMNEEHGVRCAQSLN